MAQFKPAFLRLIKHEGYPGYGIDNNNAEVLAGINRAFWPGWEGWPIVDEIKPDKAALATHSELRAEVEIFYFNCFWKSNRFGEIENQELAEQLFDHAVNAGSETSVKILQRIIGVTVDGVCGPMTVKAVNSQADPARTLSLFKEGRAEYYRKIANGKNAKYLPIWLRRV